jgi:hypothetical protein
MPFPPAIAALTALFDGEKISPVQKQAISSSLFYFLCRILPPRLPQNEVLGFMPSLAAFLASVKSSKAETERLFALSQFFSLHESKAMFKGDAAKFLRIVPTLRLRDYRDVPCLMHHNSGLAVFCGIPGCSVTNVSVFLPLEDKFDELDPQVLAKSIEEGEDDEEAEIDDRTTVEAVCVVYDMSNSMKGPAFANESWDKDISEEDDLPSLSLSETDVHYELWRLSKFDSDIFDIIVAALKETYVLGHYAGNARATMTCLRVLASLSTRLERAVDQHPQLVDRLLRQPLDDPQTSGQTIQVFVRGAAALRGHDMSTRTFDIPANATISRLMDLIALSPDGCPLEAQRLIYGGRSYRHDDDTILTTTLLDIGAGKESNFYLQPLAVRAPQAHEGVLKTRKVFAGISHESNLLGEIECRCSDKVKKVTLKIWRKFPHAVFNKPETLQLWTDPKNSGDGYFSGHRLDHYVGQHLHLHLHPGPTRTEEMQRESRMTRLETTKQLFHAFINRLQAYNVPNQLGLILFSDKVKRVCDMTRLYERFRQHVDSSNASGDTALWDAILGTPLITLLGSIYIQSVQNHHHREARYWSQ